MFCCIYSLFFYWPVWIGQQAQLLSWTVGEWQCPFRAHSQRDGPCTSGKSVPLNVRYMGSCSSWILHISHVRICPCRGLIVLRFHSLVCFVNHSCWYFLIFVLGTNFLTGFSIPQETSVICIISLFADRQMCRDSRFVQVCVVKLYGTWIKWK